MERRGWMNMARGTVWCRNVEGYEEVLTSLKLQPCQARDVLIENKCESARNVNDFRAKENITFKR